jgi:general secretion pathway protein G
MKRSESRYLATKEKLKIRGFTLMELLIAISIVGILAGIAVPKYISYRSNVKISTAINDLKMIEFEISNYVAEIDEYPDSLSEIGQDILTDPWGNPYEYLRIDGGTTPGLNGKRRRDKSANPVNSDYDLYSRGRDGKTSAQFTAKKARDDIVRANDGRYYGLAEKH